MLDHFIFSTFVNSDSWFKLQGTWFLVFNDAWVSLKQAFKAFKQERWHELNISVSFPGVFSTIPFSFFALQAFHFGKILLLKAVSLIHLISNAWQWKQIYLRIHSWIYALSLKSMQLRSQNEWNSHTSKSPDQKLYVMVWWFNMRSLCCVAYTSDQERKVTHRYPIGSTILCNGNSYAHCDVSTSKTVCQTIVIDNTLRAPRHNPVQTTGSSAMIIRVLKPGIDPDDCCYTPDKHCSHFKSVGDISLVQCLNKHSGSWTCFCQIPGLKI